MEPNPRDNTTPIVRCPRCDHPIDQHGATHPCDAVSFMGCGCQLTPNLIAVAAIQTALFGELTPTPEPLVVPKRISRQPDGSWS